MRLLVLNTAEVLPADSSEAEAMAGLGRMREEQYLWLGRELSRAGLDASTVLVVAGHHPVGGDGVRGDTGAHRRVDPFDGVGHACVRLDAEVEVPYQLFERPGVVGRSGVVGVSGQVAAEPFGADPPAAPVGVDPGEQNVSEQGRPIRIAEGKVIREIVA